MKKAPELPESRLIITDPHDWMRRLSELALSSSSSCTREEASRLREAFGLLNEAPCPALLAGVALPDSASFETMLRVRAYASAALSLLGEDSGMMLSRSGDGHCLASVILPGRSEEVTAAGDTVALAIVAALSLALCDIPIMTNDLGEEATSPALRLN